MIGRLDTVYMHEGASKNLRQGGSCAGSRRCGSENSRNISPKYFFLVRSLIFFVYLERMTKSRCAHFYSPKNYIMKTHFLKCWPAYFQAVATGVKNFEVRENDRDFKQDDILKLEEWDDENYSYTGRFVEKKITYVLHGAQFGIMPGYAVLSLSDL